MGQRRLERPAPVRGKRRKPKVRPRYGRITAAGVAVAITGVTLLGGIGVLPDDSPAAASGAIRSDHATPVSLDGAGDQPADATPRSGSAARTTAKARTKAAPADDDTALPAGSGEGRRVVFDISDQRVWLVGAGDDVRRTYLVSGSLTDNLVPGTYAVYSRSRWAVGIDDSGVMQYFVRFTRGQNAPIGFHSIPTKDGRPLQRKDQLGTPQSHGCIRQDLPDAIRLWDFAPTGTTVVVTA